MTDYTKLIERVRVYEQDHAPDGWPAIKMRDVSALADAIESLQAENERLKADRERDAFRLVWAMNWMRMSVHDHGFTKHVLERGGTADYSDCATYIDKCTTATQEAAHGIHAKGGHHEDA